MELPCVYSDKDCGTSTTTAKGSAGEAAAREPSPGIGYTAPAQSPGWNANADNYSQATAAYANLVGHSLPKGSANTVRLDGQNQVTFSYTSYYGSRFTFAVRSDGTYSDQIACSSSNTSCQDKSESGRISTEAARVLFVSAGATGITLNASEQATLAQFQGALATARGEDLESAGYMGGCL